MSCGISRTIPAEIDLIAPNKMLKSSPVCLVHLVCSVYLVCLVCLVYLGCLVGISFNQTNQIDQTNRSLSGLRLAGGLCLFPLEFGPTVIEPLSGCAGCVQRLGSFL